MPPRRKKALPPLNLHDETIGRRISRIRKRKVLTQKELAERIGIIRGLVSDYERGRLHLNDEMVIRFAIALEVSADIVLGLEELNIKENEYSYSIKQELKKIKKLPREEQDRIAQVIRATLEKTE